MTNAPIPTSPSKPLSRPALIGAGIMVMFGWILCALIAVVRLTVVPRVLDMAEQVAIELPFIVLLTWFKLLTPTVVLVGLPSMVAFVALAIATSPEPRVRWILSTLLSFALSLALGVLILSVALVVFSFPSGIV